MVRPIVWIVKEQASQGNAFDYSPAMMYGDIKFITRSDMPLHPHSTIQSVWTQDVIDFVNDYDENRDFIITTGQPTAIFAIGYALGLSRKAPRYLVWRREENRYRVLDTLTTTA